MTELHRGLAKAIAAADWLAGVGVDSLTTGGMRRTSGRAEPDLHGAA